MFRYIRTITICFFDILCAYFGWMIPFSRHPERYPLQYRYAKVRKLTLKVTKYMHVDIIAKNPEILKTPRTYVFIGNHTSMYDALIMLCLSEYPVSFVGKHEIRHMPFFGRIMKAIDAVFIERDNLKKEVAVLREVKLSLKEKKMSWVIFPEGTRNKNPEGPLLPFKAGSFRMAFDTDTPIVPIAIYGAHRPLNTKYRLKRFPIHVSFLDTITPDQFKQQNTVTIANHVQNIIQDEVKRLQVLDGHLLMMKTDKKKR